MAGFNMSEADLMKLVDDVKTELATIAKNEAGRLAKGEGSASPEGSPEASGSPSASPEASPEGSAGGEMPPAAAPSDAPPAGPEGAPEGAEAPPPGAEQPGAEQPSAGPSFEELVSLYSALPPEDFEAHAAALQQAAQQKQGAGGPPGAPPSAGPGPSPSAPPPSAPMAPAMKSEGKVKELEGQLAEMKKTMAEMTQVVEGLGKLATAPQRKATTGFTFVPMQKTEEEKAIKKFEEMSKSELTSALNQKACDPKLSKSERELITGYCLGNVKREALVDLFKEKK